MRRADQSRGLGAIASVSDEGPTVAVVAPLENKRSMRLDCHGALHAGPVLRVTVGEHKARDYLARRHAKQADPDELVVIASMLYGAAQLGFCRVLSKVIGGTA